MMSFREILTGRYAAQRFDGRTVPDETVRELLDFVRLAPSVYNLQPWRVAVVADPAVKARLQPAAYDQPQVVSCSHLFVICADTGFEGLLDRLDALLRANGVPEKEREASLSMARDFVLPMDSKHRRAFASLQCYVALGNALNGAKALGLDSCPMDGFDPKAVTEILGIPPSLVPVLLVPIGYGAGEPPRKLRFPLEEILL